MNTGVLLTKLSQEFSLSCEMLHHIVDTIFQIPLQESLETADLMVSEDAAEAIRKIFQKDIQELQKDIEETLLGDLAMYIEAIGLSEGDKKLIAWYKKCAEACLTHDIEEMTTKRLGIATELLQADISDLQKTVANVKKERTPLSKKKKQILTKAPKTESSLREEAEKRAVEATKHKGIYEQMKDDSIAQRFYQKVYLPYVEQVENIKTEAEDVLKQAQSEADALDAQIAQLSERQKQLESELDEKEKALHRYKELFAQVQDVIDHAKQLGIQVIL